RLYKVGRSARVVSSEDKDLGAQEDAFKQGWKIDEIDQDVKVTLVDHTQGRYGDNLMFDTGVLDNEQDMAEKEHDMAEKDVSTADPVTTAGEVVTTANVVVSAAEVTTASTTTTFIDELTLAQTLNEIKAAKPKSVTTAATTTTTAVTRPNTRGVIVQEPNYELASRLQVEEQGELTVEEKSKLFIELMDKRKKHFARLRAEERRRKPPTKAQKRNQMAFDKTIGWIDSFVPMGSEVREEGSEARIEGSSKRAGEELESENLKKQKLDENVEAEVDDDPEEAEMKKHMEIVPDDEVAIDVIPLATKPPIIVDWKIIKEGKMGYFQLIRANGSSKRYSSMIQMLQNIDKEDLETLWKLIKAKHRLTRPEEAYERVLWGDLKVMLEPDIESEVWRKLQGHKVTVWKLFSSSGVHFVRFINLHIFMLVEKKNPFTPATITKMLNKKLQADH
ncbi:hypothetical protein Tco_1358067, partial [Tanacetum coccineum]